MKKIIISIGIIILLIGIVSAGLIEYYGRINGTVTVEWPVFYADKGEGLLINHKSISCIGPYSFSNDDSRKFKTSNLEGIDFNYIPKINFYVRANTSVIGENLTLIFGYYNSNDNIKLCSKNVTLNDSSVYEEVGPINCNSTSIPTNIDYFYYEIKGNCLDCTYKIDKCENGFQTKIEVIDSI